MIYFFTNLPLPIAFLIVLAGSIACIGCSIGCIVYAVRTKKRYVIPMFVCILIVSVVAFALAVAEQQQASPEILRILRYILIGGGVLVILVLWLNVLYLAKRGLIPQEKLYLLKHAKVTFIFVGICVIACVIISIIFPKSAT